MSRIKSYARIAITLPGKDLAAADRLAQALDRSRSWVVAEAIRRFTAPGAATSGRAEGSAQTTTAVPSPAPAPAAHGLGASRLAQLERDMSLTPEARVRAAEETLRLTELGRKPRTHTLRAFATYLDYLDWKRSRDPGR